VATGQDAVVEAAGELSDDLMETVSLGTRRFDNLLRCRPDSSSMHAAGVS